VTWASDDVEQALGALRTEQLLLLAGAG
jgi:hypothetical protein